MKLLLLPLYCLLTATALLAGETDSYRTFTDSQGRSVRATIIRTGPTEIWIRREDGRTFQVPRATFSEKDRNYILRWETLDALKSPDALEFSARRYSGGQRKVTETRTERTTTELFGFAITLKNNSSIDLSNLEIEYRCFVWVADHLGQSRQNRRLLAYSGREKFDRFSPRSSVKIKTTPVALRQIRLNSNVYSTVTNQRRSNDDLRGVWIKIRQNGELIAEFSSAPGLLETEAPDLFEHYRWR